MAKDEPVLSTDELFEAMQRDEAVGATKLSPRDYALLRGKRPQLVYYYIRTGKLSLEKCICGRNVVDVQEADTLFGTAKDDGDGEE